MKYEKIKILDIEESEDGNKLEVPFEVPGKKFGQSYPKRLKHVFPKKEHFIEEIDNKGTKRFEKILRDLYLEKDRDKQERSKVDSKIDDLKKEMKGKKYEKKK